MALNQLIIKLFESKNLQVKMRIEREFKKRPVFYDPKTDNYLNYRITEIYNDLMTIDSGFFDEIEKPKDHIVEILFNYLSIK